MQVALVADWLTTLGGAERTLAEFATLWPKSPIFTTVVNRRAVSSGIPSNIVPTRLQSLYRMIKRHQILLPLMPRAMEEIDLRGYDVVLSSSHAVGKGIVPPSNAVHVCYCHTPMRYAWEMEDQYLQDFHVPKILQGVMKRELKKLRRWDLSTAKRVDRFIANSTETAARIERIYGRSSVVIPPPVHDRFYRQELIEPTARTYFIAVGRFVPYKRFDLLIEWANARRLPLVIVGKGQEEKRLRAMAGPTIEFRGRVSDDQLPSLYASAKAALFPTYEDAGIVPLEAQACGTPVIAYGKGGSLDTIVDGKTGLFFHEQSVESLTTVMHIFSETEFDPRAIRNHAKQFSAEGFRGKIQHEVLSALSSR